jgi:hypothetical protein
MRMRLTRIAVVIALLPAALLVGCGDDDALKEQCVEELTSVGQSEAEAEKTCAVPDEAEVDKAVDEAVESCLAIVDELPESAREQARQDCMEAGG